VEVGRLIANADLSMMKAADRGDAMGEWTHAFGLALKTTRGGFADRQGVPRAAAKPAAAETAPASTSTDLRFIDGSTATNESPAREATHA
jgi:hypothetical protein